MRDSLYFLDPHTWVSQLPEEAKELVLSCGETAIESALTSIGPVAWMKALCDEGFLLPAGITNQGQLKHKMGCPLKNHDIFRLAVFYTRVQMSLYLREHTSLFHSRIEGRAKSKDLQAAGIIAAQLLIGGRKKWMIPFDTKGKFVIEWWKDTTFYG